MRAGPTPLMKDTPEQGMLSPRNRRKQHLPAFTGRPLRPTVMTGLLTGPGTRTRTAAGRGSRSLTPSSLKDCQERVRIIRSSHSTARPTPVPTTSGSTNRKSAEATPKPPPIPYSPLRAGPLRSRRSTRDSRLYPTGTAPAAGTIPVPEALSLPLTCRSGSSGRSIH